MKRINITVLIIIVFNISLLQAYDWPIKESTTQHQTNATLGEWREGPPIHFHAGVDINAPCSTKVYTIEGGDTCYKDLVPSPRGINIGHFRYYHMVIRDTIQDSSFIASDSFFAKTDVGNHVHLQEGDVILEHPGNPGNVHWLNPLRNGAITPYADYTNPHIDSIKFYRQGGSAQLNADSLNGKVDIVAVAGDTRTDSTGHSAGHNVSVYRIGYLVKNMQDSIVKPYWEKVKFDSIPSNSYFSLVYAEGSSETHFRYYVTNDVFNPDPGLKNMYWNTRQKIGEPDSINADSIEEAKYPDGEYKVIIKAFDIAYGIKENCKTRTINANIANFRPKVKYTDPYNGQNNVDLNKKVHITFSEDMNKRVDLNSAISISPGVSGKFEWINDNEIEFTPEPAFVESTTYTITLSDQLKDLQNQKLIPYTFSFTTGLNNAYHVYPTTFQWENIDSWDISTNWSQ